MLGFVYKFMPKNFTIEAKFTLNSLVDDGLQIDLQLH